MAAFKARARVLREMRDDTDHSLASIASSTGSGHGTISGDTTNASRAGSLGIDQRTICSEFSPDNSDIFASTGIMEYRFQLNPNPKPQQSPKTQTPQPKHAAPELRDTAKKYGKWAPKTAPSPVISSATLRNAFPDFTQPGPADDTPTIKSRKENTVSSRSSRFSRKPSQATVAPTQSTQTFSIPQEAASKPDTSYNIPVLARDGKIEAPPKQRSHQPVDGIEIPHVEEDIYRMIHQLRSDFDKMAAQNAVMQRRNSDSAIGSQDHSAQMYQFDTHIQSMNSELANLQQELKASKEMVEKLTSSLEQKDGEISELRDRVARLESHQPQPTENMTSAYLAIDIEAAKDQSDPPPVSYSSKPRSRSNSENSITHSVQDDVSHHSEVRSESRGDTTQPILEDPRPMSPARSDSHVDTTTQHIPEDFRPVSPIRSERPVSPSGSDRPFSPVEIQPEATETSNTSHAAHQLLQGLCLHKCTNCSICTRLSAFEERSRTGAPLRRETVHVKRQVPVSQRTFTTQEEPTLRPVQAPGRALLGVLKYMEDELTHLKRDHGRMTLAYHQRSAASEKQYRVAASAQLQHLREAIDRKSQHIYDLYDVLEGQHDAGQLVDQSFDMTVVEQD